MPDVEIKYKGSQIASMSASGVKTLLTGDLFCEDDIVVSYTKPSASLQSKSVTPTESTQTVTADPGYDGLSQVSVGAISSSYVGSNVPRQAAQTITPTTTDQTIASGKYLTGAQTIKGDANLLAENIKKDVVLFGITGTLESGGGGGGGGGTYGKLSLNVQPTSSKIVTFTNVKTSAMPDAFYMKNGYSTSKAFGSYSDLTLMSLAVFKSSSGYNGVVSYKRGTYYLTATSLPAGSYGFDKWFTMTFDSDNKTLTIEIKSTANNDITFDTADYHTLFGLY